jgi:hypothetical protein
MAPVIGAGGNWLRMSFVVTLRDLRGLPVWGGFRYLGVLVLELQEAP